MFKGSSTAMSKSRLVVKRLTDYSGNKGHDRHIDFDECKRIGLKVSAFESDQTLQDLVLTVHHCYMHTLMNTAAYKIIENQQGIGFVKQAQAPPAAQ
jgi:hypothetical protein